MCDRNYQRMHGSCAKLVTAGATLVFYFSGLCMTAVGNAAQEVVNNVREQFRLYKQTVVTSSVPFVVLVQCSIAVLNTQCFLMF